jgi:hypothetical protein
MRALEVFKERKKKPETVIAGFQDERFIKAGSSRIGYFKLRQFS